MLKVFSAVSVFNGIDVMRMTRTGLLMKRSEGDVGQKILKID